MPNLYCSYEDRAYNAIGVRLLALSVARHDPGAQLVLFLKNMPAELTDWLEARPDVTLLPCPDDLLGSWDIKPDILRLLLDRGHHRVTWIDTDIVIIGPFAHHFDVADEVYVATEEPFTCTLGSRFTIGSRFRTERWGLVPGRDIPVTVNSCIVSVTAAHRRVLDQWGAMSRDPRYLEERKKYWKNKPMHMIGGQDLMTAVLGSTTFDGLTLKLLRKGTDIAQAKNHNGYSSFDRLRNLFRGLPAFVHAQGAKPWQSDGPRKLELELSPYRYAAKALAPSVPLADWPASERGWLTPKTTLSRWLDRLLGQNPNLTGLPFAFAHDVKHYLLRYVLARRPDAPAPMTPASETPAN